VSSTPVSMSPLEAVTAGNYGYLEQLYNNYRADRDSVDAQWAAFFAGFDLAGVSPLEGPGKIGKMDLQLNDLIQAYREYGHLIAHLDPLGHNVQRHKFLELKEFGLEEADLNRMVNASIFRSGGDRCTLRELITMLRQTYCGTFAVEYMEIRDPEHRQWLQEQMEPRLNKLDFSPEQRFELLKRVIQAEDFETFLHKRFPTVKRFSNEGGDTLINLLDEVIHLGADLGVDEMLFGMAHRGRLNVLTHTLRKPYEKMMSEVLGRKTTTHPGDGDVKYHLGYAYDHRTPSGKVIHLSLAANPSHLELVNPVVEGICRAKQARKGDFERLRTVPVLIHGDAAFAGQGIVAETLHMSELDAYATGGTIHVIINNQVGFTTNPSDGRFTRYPSDMAKSIQAPVFHVNADDPEAVAYAGRLAIAFRQRFKADVIIHLVCYRRRGHNELDDASVTQPVMAREIANHPTVRQIYAQRLIAAGVVTQAQVDEYTATLHKQLEDALEYAKNFKPSDNPPPVYGAWKDLASPGKDWHAQTGVSKEKLRALAETLCRVPEGFNVHPTVAKMMQQRVESVTQESEINWGTGEMLALGSLIDEGTWVRLTGQDVCRGTFSHRNAVWFDHQNGRPYCPLAKMAEGRARFMIVNTPLTEFAVLGFEYGMASADPHALIMWEAQFGDFVNMTQPILDQYLSSAESKWGKYNGLVLLLPHGYEGQGPEHSHARLERFLQLCAEDNMQVVYPSTPAQYFHMLRRQMKRAYRRPLIVMTPKSMLRNKLAVSTLDEFAAPGFIDLIDEVELTDKSQIKRVLVCSGKIYYELLAERTKQGIKDVAILRLEQIYPFPIEDLQRISQTYPKGVEVLWVQEEPRNNGVYPFIGAKLHYYWEGMQKLVYVGRKPSASPASGSHERHVAEQADIIARALGLASLNTQNTSNVTSGTVGKPLPSNVSSSEIVPLTK